MPALAELVEERAAAAVATAPYLDARTFFALKAKLVACSG
jgi:hypothetical protein